MGVSRIIEQRVAQVLRNIVEDLTPNDDGAYGSKNLQSLIEQENATLLFFVKSCWKNCRRFCIRCGEYKICIMMDKRYQLMLFRYTFHVFSGI